MLKESFCPDNMVILRLENGVLVTVAPLFSHKYCSIGNGMLYLQPFLRLLLIYLYFINIFATC